MKRFPVLNSNCGGVSLRLRARRGKSLRGCTVKPRALALQEIKSHYANMGMTAVSSTPEQFSAYVQNEIARWAKIVKAAGISAD